jgi:endonuclease/exonuclease/phosphatase family metal-dependent hydrolase
MNRILNKILAVTFAAANILSVTAQSGIHNFANYNIHYTNDAADTGERAWSARGTYVMQIIKDYDFDVFGMEEVTGRNGKYAVNTATNTSQLEDLKAGLTDYTLLTYERDGAAANKDYSYNVIAYKTNKYECLSTGCFWISPTPDTPSNGWDSNYPIKRTCAWAKMKVKSTGEIFYFAVAHCNYGPSLDGPNGGYLVTHRLSEMAGELPIILVGDFNMLRIDHNEAYREYAASFSDAALTAKTAGCLPTENGTTVCTAQNWYPVTNSQFNGKEYDFGFYRAMNVEERYIITENYGRSVNPSDHFPILMRCSLSKSKNIYVNGSAAADGDGTIATPYKSLGTAMNQALAGDVVHATAGEYKESLKINSPAKIIGGYDSQFSEITGKTILDGDINGDDGSGNKSDNLSNLIIAENYVGLDISNFQLRNAASSIRSTDGALVTGGAELTLNNVDFANDSASVGGGGLIARCRDINLQQCHFSNNKTAGTGAGALVYATGTVGINNCVFDGNTAIAGAALHIVDATEMRVSNNSFINNTDKQFGAFYFPTVTNTSQYGTFTFAASANAYNISLWNNTFANNKLTSPSGLPLITKGFGGAAIYAHFSNSTTAFNMAHNSIVGNISTFGGSNKANYGGTAVRVFGGKVILMNNIIAGNYNDGAYADIYVDTSATVAKDQYNIISAATTTNITLSEKDFKAESYDVAITALANTLDGKAENGKFIATVADNGGLTPTVKPISKEFAGTNVAVITPFLRYIESSFNIDIDGDGSISGALKYDQRNSERASSSMPGACEYVGDLGVKLINDAKKNVALKSLAGNIYQLTRNNGGVLGNIYVYSISGHESMRRNVTENNVSLDLSRLASGIYIIALADACFKVLVR